MLQPARCVSKVGKGTAKWFDKKAGNCKIDQGNVLSVLMSMRITEPFIDDLINGSSPVTTIQDAHQVSKTAAGDAIAEEVEQEAQGQAGEPTRRQKADRVAEQILARAARETRAKYLTPRLERKFHVNNASSLFQPDSLASTKVVHAGGSAVVNGFEVEGQRELTKAALQMAATAIDELEHVRRAQQHHARKQMQVQRQRRKPTDSRGTSSFLNAARARRVRAALAEEASPGPGSYYVSSRLKHKRPLSASFAYSSQAGGRHMVALQAREEQLGRVASESARQLKAWAAAQAAEADAAVQAAASGKPGGESGEDGGEAGMPSDYVLIGRIQQMHPIHIHPRTTDRRAPASASLPFKTVSRQQRERLRPLSASATSPALGPGCHDVDMRAVWPALRNAAGDFSKHSTRPAPTATTSTPTNLGPGSVLEEAPLDLCGKAVAAGHLADARVPNLALHTPRPGSEPHCAAPPPACRTAAEPEAQPEESHDAGEAGNVARGGPAAAPRAAEGLDLPHTICEDEAYDPQDSEAFIINDDSESDGEDAPELEQVDGTGMLLHHRAPCSESQTRPASARPSSRRSAPRPRPGTAAPASSAAARAPEGGEHGRAATRRTCRGSSAPPPRSAPAAAGSWSPGLKLVSSARWGATRSPAKPRALGGARPRSAQSSTARTACRDAPCRPASARCADVTPGPGDYLGPHARLRSTGLDTAVPGGSQPCSSRAGHLAGMRIMGTSGVVPVSGRSCSDTAALSYDPNPDACAHRRRSPSWKLPANHHANSRRWLTPEALELLITS